ncbi:MAG TPA: SDR family NAD(P)-dependent oxidoreductase [Tepidisphaeraceae bacterium]|nr:SDR family NAD(P)-dependent oxidoreductase [Tepidisphaeraceae bacterium]
MSPTTAWPEFSTSDAPIDALVKLSRFYGANPEFVLAGGGNTSVKVGDRLFVKGSGHALATISADGFVELDRKKLESLLKSKLSDDRMKREEEFKTAIMASRLAAERGQRPSVEALLHHLMPGTFVVHTHSTLVNMLTCSARGKALMRGVLGEDAIWIPEVDPGFVLSQTLQQALAEYKTATGRDCPRAVLMQNHGLVIAGDTPEAIRKNTDWLISVLHAHLEKTPATDPFGAVTRIEDPKRVRQLVTLIGPALRGLLASGETLPIVAFDDSHDVMNLVGGVEAQTVATTGPLTPDQIVYCKSFPLWIDPPDSVEAIRSAIEQHRAKHKADPHVVLVKGLGMFTIGDDLNGARTAQAVYTDAIKIMAGARRLGGVNYLNADLRRFIEEWEVESYRKGIAAAGRAGGRAAGKVVIVTGAAQGFGLEISQDAASQGAYVVLTDINAEGTAKAAAALNERLGKTRAIGLPINVTSGESIEEAIYQTVRVFGGVDCFISNAGVLKAGSVKTQSEKDFDFVTNVNYKGFFLCTQKVAPILATQHVAKRDYWSDIIQINSKSGLQGSNRNGAYAGGKFGGIGLVQSFALELVEDGVKVNAICPGNFFDGPLWSDPVNGLFAQYLKSGKVPGAKTIEDVKRSYESKVPMNRGCTTADVVKAIYYLMEQKYETGQAVPVTGGQVMLK